MACKLSELPLYASEARNVSTGTDAYTCVQQVEHAIACIRSIQKQNLGASRLHGRIQVNKLHIDEKGEGRVCPILFLTLTLFCICNSFLAYLADMLYGCIQKANTDRHT